MLRCSQNVEHAPTSTVTDTVELEESDATTAICQVTWSGQLFDTIERIAVAVQSDHSNLLGPLTTK